ncbi:DUF262 domain-containing protein [Botrimarina sp.]|uniref:GmrSD restriction endonuclease domain-containing protein n=1 Tax=Botrimarina sp. TaxID=2795802 RepID=UPI0032EF02B8
MERTQETWPLVSVQHYRETINPTPSYQRYAVWSRPQQQLLIDSILRGMDIPKLYLREVEGDGPFKYEAVDGQQRLRAVWEFFADEYPLSERFSPEHGSVRYSELPNEERRLVELYQFSVVIIKRAHEAEIREMFCRLQNGKPLNAAEKRNAMVSQMRDFCEQLSEHPFFESVRFGNGRMQHQQVAAQTVLLELNGGPTNVRNNMLQAMYEEKCNFDGSGRLAKRVKKVYDFLKSCFPDRTPELKRGNVVSLYLLASSLMDAFRLRGKERDFRDFLIDFEAKRRVNEDDNELVRYNERLSHASDSEEAIEFRHRVLLRAFHEFCPDLVPIDSQRSFDEGQRIAIYRRDGGQCKYCGADVPWEGFDADHVVPHSKGGPTTVTNGWLACGTCNRQKGAKVSST